jgi:hypothetical protein
LVESKVICNLRGELYYCSFVNYLKFVVKQINLNFTQIQLTVLN